MSFLGIDASDWLKGGLGLAGTIYGYNKSGSSAPNIPYTPFPTSLGQVGIDRKYSTPHSTLESGALTLDPSIRETQDVALGNANTLFENFMGNRSAFVDARVAPLEQSLNERKAELRRELGRRKVFGSFANKDLTSLDSAAARELGHARSLAEFEALNAGRGLNQDIANIAQQRAQTELAGLGLSAQTIAQLLSLAGNISANSASGAIGSSRLEDIGNQNQLDIIGKGLDYLAGDVFSDGAAIPGTTAGANAIEGSGLGNVLNPLAAIPSAIGLTGAETGLSLSSALPGGQANMLAQQTAEFGALGKEATRGSLASNPNLDPVSQINNLNATNPPGAGVEGFSPNQIAAAEKAGVAPSMINSAGTHATVDGFTYALGQPLQSLSGMTFEQAVAAANTAASGGGLTGAAGSWAGPATSNVVSLGEPAAAGSMKSFLNGFGQAAIPVTAFLTAAYTMEQMSKAPQMQHVPEDTKFMVNTPLSTYQQSFGAIKNATNSEGMEAMYMTDQLSNAFNKWDEGVINYIQQFPRDMANLHSIQHVLSQQRPLTRKDGESSSDWIRRNLDVRLDKLVSAGIMPGQTKSGEINTELQNALDTRGGTSESFIGYKGGRHSDYQGESLNSILRNTNYTSSNAVDQNGNQWYQGFESAPYGTAGDEWVGWRQAHDRDLNAARSGSGQTGIGYGDITNYFDNQFQDLKYTPSEAYSAAYEAEKAASRSALEQERIARQSEQRSPDYTPQFSEWEIQYGLKNPEFAKSVPGLMDAMIAYEAAKLRGVN